MSREKKRPDPRIIFTSATIQIAAGRSETLNSASVSFDINLPVGQAREAESF